MLKPKPPCVSDCLRRSITCHAECREYADYAGKLKKYNDAVKAEKRKELYWRKKNEQKRAERYFEES